AILLAVNRTTRDVRRRMVPRGRARWRAPLWLAVAGILFWRWSYDSGATRLGPDGQPDFSIGSGIAAIAIPLLILWVLWTLIRGSRDQRIVQQAAIAMQTRDFAKVFELAETHPKPFARSA